MVLLGNTSNLFMCRADELSEINQLSKIEYLSSKKKFQQAHKVIEPLLKNNPNNAALHLALAELLGSEGKTAESINEYLTVRRIDNSDLQSCLKLSQLYAENSDQENSLRYARLAVAIKPDSLHAKIGLVNAFIENNLTRAAQEEFSNLLAKSKNNPDVLILGYKLGKKQGNNNKAKYYLLETIRYSKDPTRFELELSDLLEHMRDYKAARKCLEDLLSKYPDYSEARLRLAQNLEFYFYDFESAIKEYQNVLAINPNTKASLGIERCRKKKNDLAFRLKLMLTDR
jgi:predicted Zn-dependent protease